MRIVQWLGLMASVAVAAVGSGCHREEVEAPPLRARMIGISDKFYDVQAIDADHAVVVGYGGKMLATSDGGYTWTQVPTGTQRALYSVQFIDASTGWVSGQEGLILHTSDGGKTWEMQKSGTNVYLFSLFFLDRNHGWVVGDRSILLETHDGGVHWEVRKINTQKKDISAAEAIASQDPVLYDVQFVDANSGWAVGEFGKILHTSDGGKTWAEQEETLLGGEIFDVLDIPTFFGVHFINAREGVATGLDGKIVHTRDGGATWKFEPLKLDYAIVDPLFRPVLFADGSGWAIGAAGEVVRRKAADTPWERVKLGMEVLTWVRGMNWLDQNNGWIVGGYGLILHTKDGGATWIPSIG